MNPMSVVCHSQKGFHIGRSLPLSLSFSCWLYDIVVTAGFSVLTICSVEPSPCPLRKSGVADADDVKRSLDDIIAAERGLARPTGFGDGWEDAEMLLLREAVDSCPG